MVGTFPLKRSLLKKKAFPEQNHFAIIHGILHNFYNFAEFARADTQIYRQISRIK